MYAFLNEQYKIYLIRTGNNQWFEMQDELNLKSLTLFFLIYTLYPNKQS